MMYFGGWLVGWCMVYPLYIGGYTTLHLSTHTSESTKYTPMYTKIHIDYQVVTKSIYTKYTKNTPKTAKKMILTLIKEIKTAYEILEIVPSDRRKSVSGCMQEKVLQDIQCKPLYLCIREEDEGTALFGCLDWSYYRMAGDKVIGNDLFLRILKLQYAPPL